MTALQEGHHAATSLREGGLAATRWVDVCRAARLLPERGVAALVGGDQVAIFLTHDGALYGLDNVDPFSGAAVLSRGIVGDRGGVPTVASPVFKQAFDLRDGRCLDDPDVSVATRVVRIADGTVQVGIPCPAP
jgi:nitrite reductase (NADH) small subunit